MIPETYEGLVSTPDGNKYFRADTDYTDYIREKCGYEVSRYVESLNEPLEKVNNFEGRITETFWSIWELLDDLDCKEQCEDSPTNPILKLKQRNEEISELRKLGRKLVEELNEYLNIF